MLGIRPFPGAGDDDGAACDRKHRNAATEPGKADGSGAGQCFGPSLEAGAGKMQRMEAKRLAPVVSAAVLPAPELDRNPAAADKVPLADAKRLPKLRDALPKRH